MTRGLKGLLEVHCMVYLLLLSEYICRPPLNRHYRDSIATDPDLGMATTVGAIALSELIPNLN
jgi:hypothetical protein